MTESLALKYRPGTLAEVVGQTPVAAVLYQMAVRRSVPEALLFAGSPGAGKTSTGRILAAMLNCDMPPGPVGEWPCRVCASCKAVADGSSGDVIEVDAASNGGVMEVRKIKDLVRYHSTGLYHVVLLDEAHSMSKEAFNALLKELEEPPENTIFILLTTEPGKIIPTIRSRCMTFTFRRLAPAVIVQRLQYICQQEQRTVEPVLLYELAERADGAMRNAVIGLDQVLRVGVGTLDMYRELMGDVDYGPGLLEAIATGTHDDMFGRLDRILEAQGDFAAVQSALISCMRDLLRLQCKGAITAQGAALDVRQALARQLDPARIVSAMQVLWDLKVKVGRTEPRSGLELAVVMMRERLAVRAPDSRTVAPAVATGNGHARMSAEALAALAGQR